MNNYIITNYCYFRFVFITLIFGYLFTLTSCVKQSDCDCGFKGVYVYLDEPYYSDNTYELDNEKIVAHFILNNRIYPITKYIPHNYRNMDSVNVSICLIKLSRYSDTDLKPLQALNPIYSLNCIEKEN